MDSPRYTEPCFTVAESARITGIAESQIRSGRAGIAMPLFGRKVASRVLFSARDLVLLRIMSDLVDCGYPPAMAMTTAFRITGELSPRPIKEDQFYLAGRIAFDVEGDEYGYWGEFDPPGQTVIAVPIGTIYAKTTAAAEARYRTPRH